jgi:hypothetical protein
MIMCVESLIALQHFTLPNEVNGRHLHIYSGYISRSEHRSALFQIIGLAKTVSLEYQLNMQNNSMVQNT